MASVVLVTGSQGFWIPPMVASLRERVRDYLVVDSRELPFSTWATQDGQEFIIGPDRWYPKRHRPQISYVWLPFFLKRTLDLFEMADRPTVIVGKADNVKSCLHYFSHVIVVEKSRYTKVPESKSERTSPESENSSDDSPLLDVSAGLIKSTEFHPVPWDRLGRHQDVVCRILSSLHFSSTSTS